MLIICEGIDKCGKSTYVRSIVQQYIEVVSDADLYTLEIDENIKVVGFHFVYGCDEKKWLKFCVELSKKHIVYMDRCLLGEIAYSSVYRPYAEKKCTLLDFDIVKSVPHIIMHFERDVDSDYIKSLDVEDRIERALYKLILVKENYADIMSQLKDLDYNIYKISFNKKKELICK